MRHSFALQHACALACTCGGLCVQEGCAPGVLHKLSQGAQVFLSLMLLRCCCGIMMLDISQPNAARRVGIALTQCRAIVLHNN